ncbi:PEP/pyruvate-binding domain-containing protein [Bacillus pacificus]
MSSFVLDFQEIEKTQLSLVGGKGLNLGELSNIQGIQVPEGFCVTTVGYEKAIEQNEELQTLLQQLTELKREDRAQIGEISKKIREVIMAVEIPSDVVEAVTHYLSRFGNEHAYAVRSSATAEDLPYASFAGQQDTYLNIIGKEAIFAACKKVLGVFIYRASNYVPHAKMVLNIIKFLYVLSFNKWFSLRLREFYLRLIRLLLTERCYQLMPVLDLVRR